MNKYCEFPSPERNCLAVLAKLRAAMDDENELLLRVLITDYEALVDDPKNDRELKEARELLAYLEHKRRM